jgi:single-strand DNA-binding protein
MLNSIAIHGRLTKDTELKQTQGGAVVLSFSIANDRFLNGQKKTDFFDVIAWNQNAKFINQHFKKGDGIIIIGRIQTREYTTQDGTTRRVVEIVVDRVEFAGGGTKTEKTADSGDSADVDDDPFEV